MAGLSVTVLVDNTAQGLGLLAEHGLAYWIEYEGTRVLFDTGQGAVLAGNARRLGIALERMDALVLSHGHVDHTGGVPGVLAGAGPVPVYVHPAAQAAKYARNEDGSSRLIGMPAAARQALAERAAQVTWTGEPRVVRPGILVTGPIPRETDFEDTGGPFYLDAACQVPDALEDDQAVCLETPAGTVVVLGCGHAGVINTLRHVRRLTGGRPLAAVLGGMHLVAASPGRVEQTVAHLRGLGVAWIMPGHCTGLAATVALWQAFPGRCTPCHVGARFSTGDAP